MNVMNTDLWRFVDATGTWASDAYGLPQMTGRVLAWLLVSDPPEQSAAELAEALGASKGSISSATTRLVRMRLVERVQERGERAYRYRIRPEAWDDQIRDPSVGETRKLLAMGLGALAGESKARRERLEELDAHLAWYEERMDELYDEWQEYKRKKLRGGRSG
jgi:DNA-binding transcriptional regulator GbsR (MarR family)